MLPASAGEVCIFPSTFWLDGTWTRLGPPGLTGTPDTPPGGNRPQLQDVVAHFSCYASGHTLPPAPFP
jgi:hypothetical protein